jgi:hypothetical protein
VAPKVAGSSPVGHPLRTARGDGRSDRTSWVLGRDLAGSLMRSVMRCCVARGFLSGDGDNGRRTLFRDPWEDETQREVVIET